MSSLVLAVAQWAVYAAAAQASPSVITVVNPNDSGPGSLRAALAVASAGDIVRFSLPPNSTILLTSGELSVHTPLTIDGSTALSLTVSGNHASRVLSTTAPLTIRALIIADGNASGDGGGIAAAAALTLTGVGVVNNRAGSMGGGVFAGGAVTLRDSIFQNNQAQVSGGGLMTQGALDMAGTLFLGNTANGVGGGALVLGAARLNGGAFQNNSANYSGGGGLYASTSLEMTGTVFLSNAVYGAGGGAFAEGAVKLHGGLFRDNRAAGFGGGLATYATADLRATQLISNSADSDGGGADILGTATLQDVLLQDNRSRNGGGGLHVWTAYITETKFLSNTAYFGGGLMAQGALSLREGRFLNNGARVGGGLYTENTLRLAETEFIGNLATLWGGGANVGARVEPGGAAGSGDPVRGAGNATVVNALFARNTAYISGSALYVGSANPVQIYHTTIGALELPTVSAVAVAAGAVDLRNTIIVSHVVGIENVGGVVMQDYNLFHGNGADTVGSVAVGEQNVAGSPHFVNAALDDYHLGPGSAAVDAGVDVGIMRDFDGNLRPYGSGYDIGFDEELPITTWLYLPLVDK